MTDTEVPSFDRLAAAARAARLARADAEIEAVQRVGAWESVPPGASANAATSISGRLPLAPYPKTGRGPP